MACQPKTAELLIAPYAHRLRLTNLQGENSEMKLGQEQACYEAASFS